MALIDRVTLRRAERRLARAGVLLPGEAVLSYDLCDYQTLDDPRSIRASPIVTDRRLLIRTPRGPVAVEFDWCVAMGGSATMMALVEASGNEHGMSAASVTRVLRQPFIEATRAAYKARTSTRRIRVHRASWGSNAAVFAAVERRGMETEIRRWMATQGPPHDVPDAMMAEEAFDALAQAVGVEARLGGGGPWPLEWDPPLETGWTALWRRPAPTRD